MGRRNFSQQITHPIAQYVVLATYWKAMEMDYCEDWQENSHATSLYNSTH